MIAYMVSDRLKPDFVSESSDVDIGLRTPLSPGIAAKNIFLVSRTWVVFL